MPAVVHANAHSPPLPLDWSVFFSYFSCLAFLIRRSLRQAKARIKKKESARARRDDTSATRKALVRTTTRRRGRDLVRGDATSVRQRWASLVPCTEAAPVFASIESKPEESMRKRTLWRLPVGVPCALFLLSAAAALAPAQPMPSRALFSLAPARATPLPFLSFPLRRDSASAQITSRALAALPWLILPARL